jgi:hypothetical protein
MNKAGEDASYLLIQCPRAIELSSCLVYFFALYEPHRSVEGFIWNYGRVVGGMET